MIKKILYKILAWKLKVLSKMVLKKYKPRVIGITGSVGKTSAKVAISHALSKNFRVRQSVKNYNNELGLPLTIIGELAQGKSLIGWIKVFLKTIGLIIVKDKNFPEFLVLEMGVDRPGDMDYLTSIAQPDIGVVTTIGQSHLEFFGSEDSIKEEKEKIVKNLKEGGKAIINFDNKYCRQVINEIKENVITFGMSHGAGVKVSRIVQKLEAGKFPSLNFKVEYEGKEKYVDLKGIIGEAWVFSSLITIAVMLSIGKSFNDSVNSLAGIKGVKGRLSAVKGMLNSIVIDDTYNSSPQSAISSLKSVAEASAGSGARKVAVLGNMLELGDYSREGHIETGKTVCKQRYNVLVCVGSLSKDIAKGAADNGLPGKDIYHFADSFVAAREIKKIIKKNDIVLVKGSQGVRMERVVKSLMEEPGKAGELLVRQGSEWK